jgi:coenzyme F420-dependent glucose-6-phosphate dehydrogenase
MAEAITLMRRLWTEERVSFEGEYYRTVKATVYDRPEEPVPVYVAASGPLEIKVSYDRDADTARAACRWWAALALTSEQKTGVEDPLEMERLADANADRAHTRFIVSDDPAEVVECIGAYLDLGFNDLVLHGPGGDQHRFLDQLTIDVLPGLRERAAAARSTLTGSSV